MWSTCDWLQAFLSDYGLIWVGDKDDSADCDTAGTSANQLYHMDFDLVLQRISDLNILAGKGEYFVQTTATGARLAEKDPIKLSLYSNGIIMLDGPFRSYEEPSTQWCLQDLMDGFFPAELKDRFPDGVPFQVPIRPQMFSSENGRMCVSLGFFLHRLRIGVMKSSHPNWTHFQEKDVLFVAIEVVMALI
uniref:UBX domain-containing protein 11 n=1 Tax=Gouania willdenowi TaxID=441366 RepID=A0A8C5ESE5_GOUWI